MTRTYCQKCKVEMSDLGSSPLCYPCEEAEYTRRNPNWKDPHPCEICQKMIYYQEGMHPYVWGGSYHSCCSDECRTKLLQEDYYEPSQDDESAYCTIL